MLKRLLLAAAVLAATTVSARAQVPVCSAFGQSCVSPDTTCSAAVESPTTTICASASTTIVPDVSSLSNGLLHWWKLNEASGNRADSAGASTLTDHNTVGAAAGSPFGDNYASFTATSNEWFDTTWDSTFRIGAHDWTWVAWFKPDDIRDQGIVSNKIGNDAASTVMLYMIGGGLTYASGSSVSGVTPSGNTSTAVGTVTPGQWHMVALGWQEATKKSWIQINAGPIVLSGTLGTPNAGSNALEIGRRSASTSFDFQGGISRVGFWNKRLTAAEIVALYGNGTAPCDYPFPCQTLDLLEIHYVGDSKLADGAVQANAYTTLTAASEVNAYSTNATSGWTMANHAGAIATYIAGNSSAFNPDYIFVNIGANDVAALPAEATWKANALTVLDAYHAAWPSAQVYMMRVWRRGSAPACDTLAGWIADVVASRSTFAHLGPDERIFLENGDNGVTYTTDGIHENADGKALAAAQWLALIGY